MPALHLDRIRVPFDARRRWHNTRWWREWCFARAVWMRFRLRAAILIGLLAAGTLAFLWLEPEREHTVARALFNVWSLVFGEAPEAFPRNVILQAMFFVVPVMGLVMIVDAIVDFSQLVQDRRRAERNWCQMMACSMEDHVVLVGLGRLGYRTFRLLRKLGEPVVVLERSADNEFLDAVRRDGSPLLIGDARRIELLIEANVGKARSIIAATNDDLANLEIALDARRLKHDVRVVLRLFDQNMADKVREGFNIHIAMSQAALAAPTFAMAALDDSIVSTQVIGDELVIMQRWVVQSGGPLCNRTVGDVLNTMGFSVVERRNEIAGTRLFPPPDTRLAAGDELLVQGAYDALLRLRVGQRATTMK